MARSLQSTEGTIRILPLENLPAGSQIRKLAVLSHILPPSPSGQAMVLHRLLRAVSPVHYCLISREDYSHHPPEDDSGRLPARYYHVPAEFQFQRPNRFGLNSVRELLNLLTQTLHRAMRVWKIIQAEKCQAIMGCSGDVVNIPAAYLVSRLCRIPFYVYLFDDYLFQWTLPLHRSFVRHAERIALKGAAGIIVPNEFLRDEYNHRYGVESTVIHNPFDSEEPDALDMDMHPMELEQHEVRIVYTGAIYHANLGAFRNLISAIEQLERTDIRVHVYSSQPREVLEHEKIGGPIVYHGHVTPLEAHAIQRRADILFLPLSFNSGIPEVIRTSAPGKMGEYLASGQPILAHSPSWSFLSWYFREHECGVVVDQNDPAILAVAIQRILVDSGLRRRIGVNASVRAKVDFSLAGAQTQFTGLLSERQGAQ